MSWNSLRGNSARTNSSGPWSVFVTTCMIGEAAVDHSRHGLLTASWLVGDLSPNALRAIDAHDDRTGIRSDTRLADMLKLVDVLAIADMVLGARRHRLAREARRRGGIARIPRVPTLPRRHSHREDTKAWARPRPARRNLPRRAGTMTAREGATGDQFSREDAVRPTPSPTNRDWDLMINFFIQHRQSGEQSQRCRLVGRLSGNAWGRSLHAGVRLTCIKEADWRLRREEGIVAVADKCGLRSVWSVFSID
jgi:hypothetical protein